MSKADSVRAVSLYFFLSKNEGDLGLLHKIKIEIDIFSKGCIICI